MLLIFYPILFVLIQKESWKKKTFNVNVFWSRLMRICCFYYIKRFNEEELPNEPYIICANHTSFLDIFFMYSILPKQPFLFLGKSEILSYPLIRTFFKNLNIPVYRNNRVKAAKSFIQAKRAVKDGWSLMIFPEGGIPDDIAPEMIPFKDGAFRLAKSCDVAIVPITFTTHYKLFSDPGDILGPARPGISKVYFHPIITKEKVKELSTEELNQKVFKLIQSPFLSK